MNMKQHILTALKEQFNRWEELLASISEEQITAAHLPSNLSINDVIAHLRAWQQRSIARLKAARLAVVLIASSDHHQKHLEKLLAWLREHGNKKLVGGIE